MTDHDQVHEMIIVELREVKADVKSLLALKYQIFGIVTGVTCVITLGWQMALKFA